VLGIDLMDDWLNNGPMQVGDAFPKTWQLRTRPVFEGRALVLSILGRADLLETLLFALCDRGTDLPDCVALAPIVAELDEAGALAGRTGRKPRIGADAAAIAATARARRPHRLIIPFYSRGGRCSLISTR
jgi:hypothetical protein